MKIVYLAKQHGCSTTSYKIRILATLKEETFAGINFRGEPLSEDFMGIKKGEF